MQDIPLSQKIILEKLPPQNIEAEQATLGALLIDKDAVTRVADSLQPDDFYKDAHKIILTAMYDLYMQQEPIDIVSLANKLTEKVQLELVGGRAYLLSLINTAANPANIAHHSAIVQRKATLRRLIHAAAEITNYGYQEEQAIDMVLDKAEQSLFKVSQKFLRNNFIPLAKILPEAFQRIDEIHHESGKLRGIPSYFPDLDNILGGLQPSDLIILAARPSMGKTSMALDIARQTAVKSKVPVGIFSLEMSKEQLVDRMLCAQSGVDLWKMRTGKLSDSETSGDFPRLGEAMGVLSEAPIFIDDSGAVNIMEIRSKARRLKIEHNVGLIVIDYLQLMEGRSTHGDNRVQEISEISRSLKAVARELNIPVLALSQLSRGVESANPPIPRLSHLRESGSIEQDADVVIFIYREDYYKKDSSRPNIADILISKHRNGPIGQLELYFELGTASFKNLAKGGSMPPPV